MKVIPIAATAITNHLFNDKPQTGYRPRLATVTDADDVAEFAGRNCYQSFNRPNPKTESNADYLANILDQKHFSVLEHASVTFYIETSRSVLAEFTRHRHCSFSVVSQRYVDATKLGIHYPPAFEKLSPGAQAKARSILQSAHYDAANYYKQLVGLFSEADLPRKQAREAARAVTPNMTNSPMVVTANHRTWREIIQKRNHEAADAEFREVAAELLTHLRRIAPATYQDIPNEVYS